MRRGGKNRRVRGKKREGERKEVNVGKKRQKKDCDTKKI